MIPIIAIIAAVAALWSVYKYQATYLAVIDLLPAQFQDGLSSRSAFPEYVLRPSTPSRLQAGYVQSQAGFCVAALCFSLLGFLFQKPVIGFIVLAMFSGFAAMTFQSWKTYHTNRRRMSTADGEGGA
ncbi:hypothetical protein ACQR1V_10775 [Bradyrhizobium oligotrophicum]|uniref:hypothetical protein n=1 Tax=Bradyrhizobium TaxID=374 RepID=UPI003EBDDCA5